MTNVNPDYKIKYRAFDIEKKQLHDEVVKISESGVCIKTQFMPSTETKWMRWIGLLDVSGREIYESDIVDGHSDGYGVVTYNVSTASYDYVFSDGNIISLWEAMEFCIPIRGRTILRVVGNIYENPELMENEDGNNL